jgi:hypothetical protein
MNLWRRFERFSWSDSRAVDSAPFIGIGSLGFSVRPQPFSQTHGDAREFIHSHSRRHCDCYQLSNLDGAFADNVAPQYSMLSRRRQLHPH